MGYSYVQLMDLWVKAGGSKLSAPIAAAVAMAESGGNPNATNTNKNGSIDRGLWQINSIHGNKSTTNPLENAKSAVSISKNGVSWSPWVAYTSGSYKRFMQVDVSSRSSVAGPQAVGQGSVGSESGGIKVSEQLGDFGTFDVLKAIGNKQTWIRVGSGILGASALIGGVVLIAIALADKAGVDDVVGKVVGIVGPGGKLGKVSEVAKLAE
jgi:hypothetical protein